MDNYHGLATLIGTHSELALFRRFAILNAKNLLYLQSELVHLEDELKFIARKDECSGDGVKQAFKFCLFDLKEASGTDQDLQWRKVLEIREKLKEYNSALLQHSQMLRFDKPHRKNLSLLQEWLDRLEGGNFFLRGREAEIWESDKDLIALCSRQAEKDGLARLISDKFIPWYYSLWGHRVKQRSTSDENWHGLWHYDDAVFAAVASAISTVLSSLLPTTSILVLYFLRSPLNRLAFIMVFTTIFSLTLAIIAKAKRTDVFAATTAFAAVQVVFVGGSNFCTV